MKILILIILVILPFLEVQADAESLLALKKIAGIEDISNLPHWEESEVSKSLKISLARIDLIDPIRERSDLEVLLQSLGVLSELTSKYAEANQESGDYAQASVQIASSGLRATQKLVSFYESQGIDILEKSTDVQKGIDIAYIGYLRSLLDEPSLGPEEYEVMINMIAEQHSFYFEHLSKSAKEEATTVLVDIQNNHKNERVRNLVSEILGS